MSCRRPDDGDGGGTALVVRKRIAAVLVVGAVASAVAAQEPPAFFTTDRSLEEMQAKQAVLDTSLGTIIIEFLPAAAPNHVGYFLDNAETGVYDGTIFHQVVKRGIVSGGDPLTRDPENRDRYGTGGLGALQSEVSDETHTRGAVSAPLVPGQPDSAGSQFLITIVDQPALDGRHSVFGRVVEGIRVAERISEAEIDAAGKTIERIVLRSVTVRDRPPPAPVPFVTETVEELASYRAVLETSFGEIAIAPRPDLAPEHVRNFLRLAEVGVFDGMSFHRVVPGFVVQTGFLPTRDEPLGESQEQHVRPLQPEFSDTLHEAGTVSMARGDDPASATTSFFICTARARALDGEYSVFGQVVSGMEVVRAIENVPREDEAPLERIDLIRVRLERQAP